MTEIKTLPQNCKFEKKLFMSEVEKKMVESYASILNSLSGEAKQELIAIFSKSITSQTTAGENLDIAFDGFIPEKSAEEIIEDLRTSRHFREKDLSF